MPHYLYILALAVALLTGCGQAPPPPPDRHILQSVNNLALPATFVDTVLEDPGAPPYRFQVTVLEGWFKLEGNKYQQEIVLREEAEGYPTRRWIWSEFGTCAPSNDKLLCESAYIQNYRFELTQQGNLLNVRQDFTDPALIATFTFRK